MTLTVCHYAARGGRYRTVVQAIFPGSPRITQVSIMINLSCISTIVTTISTIFFPIRKQHVKKNCQKVQRGSKLYKVS